MKQTADHTRHDGVSRRGLVAVMVALGAVLLALAPLPPAAASVASSPPSEEASSGPSVSRIDPPDSSYGPGAVPRNTTQALSPSALPLPAGSPIGEFELLASNLKHFAIAGWALDPETDLPIDVSFDLSRSAGLSLHADQPRPDIGEMYPDYGDDHGFFEVFGITTPGWYTVCVTALNVGAGSDTPLGCGDIYISEGSPIGSVDVAVGVPGGVSVAGWAIDPDTTAPIDVHVYVDGRGTATTASESRPDVDDAFLDYGAAHGFGASIPATPGNHQVCAYAINVGPGGNSVLGCRTITVPGGSPFGSLDVAVGGLGTVSVAGWAIDPDTNAPIPVHVYVDSAGTALTSDAGRPDVANAFPGYGAAHGFGASIPATPGNHQVCAYAINVGPGGNSVLGCRTITVPGGSPFGSLDVAVGGLGTVSVAGWAIDPDTNAPIPVHVYVDSAGTALTSDAGRPDVANAFPGYGAAHGFGASIPATPGNHQVCAYAINVGPGGNSVLGCRTITVPGGSPFGSLDVAVGGLGTVSVAGWAIDPDTNAPIPVHVYVDGSPVGLVADRGRPDVAGAFPGYGAAHGFAATVGSAPGSHQVCAYGINVGSGGNALIGCQAVGVG